MEQRTPVSFINRKGLRLFGVLHTPERTSSTGLGVVLLSPGVKMRVGPQRLYLRLTRLFISLGIPVLRFDFYGLGDSEGVLEEDLLRDVYNHIEVGRFVDDTLDAMSWMEEHAGTKRFILSGLCGGAITGLLAGARDPKVAGLLSLGITPVLASRSANTATYMTSGQLDQIGHTYLKKVWSPKAWLRLLTFRTDYRLLWRSVEKRMRGGGPPPAAAEPPREDNANPLFPPAFFQMLSTRRPMLLIFGGADRLGFEFEEKFVARHRERLAPLQDGYQVHTVENANHVLSFAEWQQEMTEVSSRWLWRHFKADLVPQDAPAASAASVPPAYAVPASDAISRN
jgi:alpha/beta superfamily hydrolase